MKKTLTLAAVVGLALTAVAAPAAAAPPAGAQMNHESYWEDLGYGDCSKVELDGVGTTFVLDDLPSGWMYTLLVLKAGSGAAANHLIDNPVAGVAYDHSTGKGLSHAIVCVDEDGGSGGSGGGGWES